MSQEKLQYTRKTDKELKELAVGVANGNIFATNDPDIVEKSFMMLLMIGPDAFPTDVGLFYEHMSEAGPRSINGLPMFMSARYLNIEDTKRFVEFLADYEHMIKQFKGDSDEKLHPGD